MRGARGQHKNMIARSSQWAAGEAAQLLSACAHAIKRSLLAVEGESAYYAYLQSK